VRERARPELGRGTEDMNEAPAVPRGDLASVWDANQILVPVVAKSPVKLLAGLNHDR
jgi:hypothetical protein